jgi:hypothetical protein
MFTEKPEGNRQLGRPRHRWGHNVKIDFEEMWTEIVRLGICTSGSSFGHNNEFSGSTKEYFFLGSLNGN